MREFNFMTNFKIPCSLLHLLFRLLSFLNLIFLYNYRPFYTCHLNVLLKTYSYLREGKAILTFTFMNIGLYICTDLTFFKLIFWLILSKSRFVVSPLGIENVKLIKVFNIDGLHSTEGIK